MLMDTGLETYLGPASVLGVQEGRVRLMIHGHEVSARTAVRFYHPKEGDTVLALRREEDCYIIGVLNETGPGEIVTTGDLRIQAGGIAEMVSAREARVRAPRVRLQALNFEVMARAALEKFGRACRWVRGDLQVRAGRQRTQVEDTSELQAGRIVQCALRDVRIDGDHINLG
jgi:hypothetical protein